MSSSKYGGQISKYHASTYRLHAVNVELRAQSSGFTYTALLVAIVILGISMAAAGKYWSYVLQREKEEELLFRGEQYRLAIESYCKALCPPPPAPCIPGVYPQKIDDLAVDERFQSQAKRRHIRQLYKDPITGGDFEVFRDLTKGNRITGVYSKSDREPLRKTGFPDTSPIYSDFENKMQYSEWKFIFVPQVPGAVTAPTGTKPRI